MENDYTIGGSSHPGYYIYSIVGKGWLHSSEDRWLGSEGANDTTWKGYYRSSIEAARRLEKYRLGQVPTDIHIGGE